MPPLRVILLCIATLLVCPHCSCDDDDETRPDLDAGAEQDGSVTPPPPIDGEHDAPFETRASILGKVVSKTGAAITDATFTVFDERAAGTPRTDVVATTLPSGEFRLRLTAFPEVGTEPARTPPHRLVLVIETPSTLPAYRAVYAHPGDTPNLGNIRLVGRDSRVTPIGPEGGTATDSRGRVEIVIPKGALATTTPIVITPFDEREDFPAPLPDSTLTMYGFEAEPTGTTFSVPATVRVANALNVPTTLEVPIGSYDVVENRWEHEGVATWDGSHFAGPIRHFSTHDVNGSGGSDRLLLITKNGNPNQSAKRCGTGSAWRIGGGSVEQVFPLPGTRVRNESFSLALHYDSGLASSRKLGAKGTTGAPVSNYAVTMPSVTVQSFCVARGSSLPTATQPGQCIAPAGSCGKRRHLLRRKRRVLEFADDGAAEDERKLHRRGLRWLGRPAAGRGWEHPEHGVRDADPLGDECLRDDGHRLGLRVDGRDLRRAQSVCASRRRADQRGRHASRDAQSAFASSLHVAVWCGVGDPRSQPAFHDRRSSLTRRR